jgi:hypothetical protein
MDAGDEQLRPKVPNRNDLKGRSRQIRFAPKRFGEALEPVFIKKLVFNFFLCFFGFWEFLMRPTLDDYPISLFLAVHKFPFAAFLWQPGVPRSKKKAE